MLSQRWNPFGVCSARDEIRSAYAQCEMKFVPCMLSMDLHVKTVHILPLADHAQKFVPRMLSMRWNRFLLRSVCDKIVSAYAKHAHAIIFENYKKSQIKMQISTIKNQSFEKPFRNASNRTKVNFLKKNLFWISLQKNLVPRMLSHRENVRTSTFWRKSKEKKGNFYQKFTRAYKDLI
jgi:hypothetical protein